MNSWIFYNSTSINYLTFSEEGGYRKLCLRTGHRKNERWSPDDRMDFNSCYVQFSDAFSELGGDKLSCTPADALLVYLDIFSYDQLKQETPSQIEKNLGKDLEEIELCTSPMRNPPKRSA